MKSKIGIALITLSFLISLNPYWLIFGIPLFLVGIVIIVTSNRGLRTKLLWILLPLILWYPSMQLFTYSMGIIGTATAQKLDINFPQDFKGKAIVISNMPCGQEIELKDNREQLFIPENGILLYKGELKSGYINNRYFKIKNDGGKTEIPFRAPHMYFEESDINPDKSVVGVWLGGGGTKYIPHSDSEIEYDYREYYIISADSFESLDSNRKTRRLEEVIDSLVRSCKNKTSPNNE